MIDHCSNFQSRDIGMFPLLEKGHVEISHLSNTQGWNIIKAYFSCDENLSFSPQKNSSLETKKVQFLKFSMAQELCHKMVLEEKQDFSFNVISLSIPEFECWQSPSLNICWNKFRFPEIICLLRKLIQSGLIRLVDSGEGLCYSLVGNTSKDFN